MSETGTKARTLQGTVVSDKMNKTIVVQVDRRVKHPLYKKVITRSTKYHVHDENEQAHEGDIVTIAECRPVSKKKAWALVNVLEKAS